MKRLNANTQILAILEPQAKSDLYTKSLNFNLQKINKASPECTKCMAKMQYLSYD